MLLTKCNQHCFPAHVACPWLVAGGCVPCPCYYHSDWGWQRQSKELLVLVVAMVNFMYNLLEQKVSRRLSVSMRMLPEEINIQSGRLKNALYNVGRRHHQIHRRPLRLSRADSHYDCLTIFSRDNSLLLPSASSSDQIQDSQLSWLIHLQSKSRAVLSAPLSL